MNPAKILFIRALINLGIIKKEYRLEDWDDSGPYSQFETLRYLIKLSKLGLIEISGGFGLDLNSNYEDRFLKEYTTLIKNGDILGAKNFAGKTNLSVLNKTLDMSFTMEDLEGLIKSDNDILELNFGQDLADGIKFSLSISEAQNQKLKNLLYRSYLDVFRKDEMWSEFPERRIRYKQQRRIFLEELSHILETRPPQKLQIRWDDIYDNQPKNLDLSSVDAGISVFSMEGYKFVEVAICLEEEGIISIKDYGDLALIVDVNEDLLNQRVKEEEINKGVESPRLMTIEKPSEILLDVLKNKLPKGKPSFIETESKIIWDGKECPIPINTNQYYFCEKMFSIPFGEQVFSEDISKPIYWRKESSRSVYDAMLAVNSRIKDSFEVGSFFLWSKEFIRVNTKLVNT